MMLEGPGDTGKSTLLEVIAALLGPANVSHASLQSIAEDRFTVADLYGKLGNFCADLDAKSLQRTGTFKMIVGGDPMRAEHKFQQSFACRPFARLMFSANELPGTTDQSDAFYNRWLIVPMHNPIPHGEQSANIIRKLTTADELSGLLAYAVAALRRLVNRGRFEPSEAVTRALGEYRRKTDTATGFLEERCVFEPAATERRSTLYETYVQWCKDNGRQALGASRFNERVESGWEASTRRVKGIWEWKGLRLRTVSDGADEKSW
jgi:putative DNA primase/helicase